MLYFRLQSFPTPKLIEEFYCVEELISCHINLIEKFEREPDLNPLEQCDKILHHKSRLDELVQYYQAIGEELSKRK